ncbi:hypothetical protein AB0H86_08410 [Streptomyces sp. NPDC050997]|uniref:hypothetical protein n=1 Tax=Streptomyces sp. NPDC050997 TaxID=3155519 RepID=UPI00343E152E
MNFAVTPALGGGIGATHELGLPVLAGVTTSADIWPHAPFGTAALNTFPAAEADPAGASSGPAESL